jgi:predicted acylesterase/phospholipase RssA
MANGYLLRAQELLDLADEEDQPIKRWVDEHAEAGVSVTVIGIALAQAMIEAVDESNERRELTRRLSEMLALMHNRTGPPLEFNQLAANIWQWMLTATTLQTVTKLSLQEYAIAVVNGLTVVERSRAYHNALRDLGVSVETYRGLMAQAEDPDALRAPRAKPTVTPQRLRVLSLTGGGYRGLFTAAVLREIEQSIKPTRLADLFDVFAGTSIGGLIACALAAGAGMDTVFEAIKTSGTTVFPRKRALAARRILGPAVYDAAALRAAVCHCLGGASTMTADRLEKGLLVTSISGVTGAAVLFRSSWFGSKEASVETLTDICMATSAAPTYFKEHRVGERREPMLDGGLVANSPDILALLEVVRAHPNALNTIEMVSVGTAGVGSGGMAGDLPRFGLGWARRIVPLMMSAQERLAERQARELLPGRYVRINHSPESGQRALTEMDTVDSSMTETLLTLSKAAVNDARQAHGATLRRILT